MSYDLHLLRRETAGDDPAAAYLRMEELDELEELADPTPAEQERLRQLAADLRAASPGLDLSQPHEGFMLQLGYESERPVVIDISGIDSIRMSWSYGAEEAGPALAEVALYLPVFERHGYVAYDPQLERLFDVDRDAAAAKDVHDYVQKQVFPKYGVDTGSRRPGWKRLLGRR